MGAMTLPSGSFRLGPKGRVVLPAAVRRAAGIPEGAQVVARAIGPGRMVIETVDAVRHRVWSASSEGDGVDSTTDVRALREEDIVTADRAAQVRSRVCEDTAESDEAGSALLAHLGL
jgi:bifunctional DNA-binding transcriptional regulator/antitoxin component of YhaV-PrlF toxin-antitoxin module